MRSESRTTSWRLQVLFCVLSSALGLTVATSGAGAHPGHRGSERLLKLDLSGEQPRFSYALVLAPDQASVLRKQADTNGDGQVNDTEQEAAMGRMTAALLGALTLCRGPALEQLTCSAANGHAPLSREAEGWGAGDDVALALSWELPVALEADDSALRVEERFAREHVARTAAVIEPPTQVPLTRAGSGALSEQGGVELEFSWEEEGRADAPRVLFAEWRTPAATWAAWGVALALLVLAGGLGVWALQRRSAPVREARVVS